MTRILIYSRNLRFWHASAVDGARAFRELGERHGFTADATEDPAAFRPDALRRYAAVVFLSTGGDVLDEAGQDALRAHLTAGHGWLGVHAASTTAYDWPWFEGLVGARFAGHPPIQTAPVRVADPGHPATAHLPARWEWTDEWYDFRSDPRENGARVLLTVDEADYRGATMGRGPAHPLAWCGEHDGAPTFYTSLGHSPEAYADPAFRTHLLGGLRHLGISP
ncbi:ThuA domain-containing protein [Kitasatospora sp. NPDC088351]|uniref:ThuA domain-containing protein n=1 Tax=Kitasatospora sp. NPDC088351 TaxID=3155180 RepID=UPI003425BA06